MPFSGVDTKTPMALAQLRSSALQSCWPNAASMDLAWIDTDLRVRSRYGPIVDFIEIGEPVTTSVLPLFGLEDDIAKLRMSRDHRSTCRRYRSSAVPQAAPRLNLLIVWDAGQNAYLLIISRAVTKADLEVELSRHIRARLMAEAEVKQKSRELEHRQSRSRRICRCHLARSQVAAPSHALSGQRSRKGDGREGRHAARGSC